MEKAKEDKKSNLFPLPVTVEGFNTLWDDTPTVMGVYRKGVSRDANQKWGYSRLMLENINGMDLYTPCGYDPNKGTPTLQSCVAQLILPLTLCKWYNVCYMTYVTPIV